MVTATMDGKIVSWQNNYGAAPAPAPSATFNSVSAPAVETEAKVDNASLFLRICG
jgi:hypothetical protein